MYLFLTDLRYDFIYLVISMFKQTYFGIYLFVSLLVVSLFRSLVI